MKYKAGTRRRANEYEKALVEWWKKNQIFEKSVEQRPVDDSYVFYDGPPFITGMPHHGTLLSSIVKDAVPRFWTMRGKRVERRWGWDCHGLPAENFVEKQLGITDRREIDTDVPSSRISSSEPASAPSQDTKSSSVRSSDLPRTSSKLTTSGGVMPTKKISLEDYILKARESMVANSETWEGTIDRVGRWVNFKGAYRTMDKNFMESVWWAFKTLYEKGKIYEGAKVLMYDTKFATPVSKSEVTMDNDAYQEVTDPSAYVCFALRDSSSLAIALSDSPVHSHRMQNTAPLRASNLPSTSSKNTSSLGLEYKAVYLLAWTTTPWTLAGNMALAVNPEMEYGAYDAGEGRVFVMLTSKAEELRKKLELDLPELAKFKGSELVGLEYEPLSIGDGGQKLVDWKKFEKNYYPAEAENAHKVWGAEFVSDGDGTGIVHIAPAYGEDDYELGRKNKVPCIDVLDEYGCYLPGADEGLKSAGVRPNEDGQIQIWEANKFIAKCLEENGPIEKIEYIKHEYPFNPRSKQRIMYRAFPSWFFDIQGSKPLMLEKNEQINWFPGYLKHGRFAKNIEQAPDWNLSRDRFWATAMPVWKGDKGTVKVVGSYAELKELSGVELEDYHRPWVDKIEFDIDGEHFTRIEKVLDCWFESGSMPFAQLHYPFENKEKFERNYPADFIVEYVGQVRAWFYYVHAVNTALFGENAFKNVITTGTLAGNDGRKMSKSLGNYTDPNVLMDQYSADALRFLLLSSPVLSGEDFALLDKDVSDVQRKLGMLWNVYDFFTTYAEVDNWDSDSFSSRISSANFATQNSAAGRHLTKESKLSFDSDSYGSSEPASAPSQDTKSSSVRSSDLPRTSSKITSSEGKWKSGKIADLKNPLDRWILARLYETRKIVIGGMEDYDLPKALSPILPFIDDLSNWFVRRSRRRFWKADDDADKNEAYWTLWKVLEKTAVLLAPFTPFLAEELWQNVVGGWDKDKSVHLLDYPMTTEIDDKEILAQMARVREVINEGLMLRMRRSETEAQVKVRQPLAKLVYAGEELPEWGIEIVKDEVNVKAVERGEETWIDKEITEDLAKEGFARELVRAVQSARKKAGLQVDDRIKLSVSCDVPEEWQKMVKAEVLAEEMVKNQNFAYDEITKVNGENVTISLEKM